MWCQNEYRSFSLAQHTPVSTSCTQSRRCGMLPAGCTSREVPAALSAVQAARGAGVGGAADAGGPVSGQPQQRGALLAPPAAATPAASVLAGASSWIVSPSRTNHSDSASGQCCGTAAMRLQQRRSEVQVHDTNCIDMCRRMQSPWMMKPRIRWAAWTWRRLAAMGQLSDVTAGHWARVSRCDVEMDGSGVKF